MFKPSSASDLFGLTHELWHLAVETQLVIAMRMMGMAGIWSVTPQENKRMVNEKVQAFTESGVAMGMAAMRFSRPEQIMAAGLRPLRVKTRSNSRRLSRRGPRAIGR